MYSQCPECLVRFRVTATALRAAHGIVRCGRCGNAFDALERLSDSIPPAVPQDVPPVPSMVSMSALSSSEPGANTEYHFSVQDLESVFVEAGDWREAFPRSGPAADAVAGRDGLEQEPANVVVDEGAPVEDITLEGERADADALPEELEPTVDLDSTDEIEILHYVPESAYPEEEGEARGTDDREFESLAQELQVGEQPQDEPLPPFLRQPESAGALDASTQSEPEPDADARVAAATVAATEPSEEPVSLAAQRWRRPVDDGEPVPAARSGSALGTLAWTVGSLALALVLAAQLVHHFRQDLARHPQVGPPLRTAYERLGIELLPNWDLAALELRQWGNDAPDEGRMVVRASLTNRAGFAQPHPILRLELEDRFGATVATRDFEPADYLKNPSQAGRLLAPGSSSEAELVLADPGQEAVGYRLDVCLRESPSLLRCARGPG
jgi:predicted Zn finger-like uncharacterized protein